VDKNTLYYLNETHDGEEIEWHNDESTYENLALRNRHEVSIDKGGSATLICLFDPAPTGLEKHLPGEYSSYTPVSKILGTEAYDKFLEDVKPQDEMMDTLSLLEAEGDLNEEAIRETKIWNIYQSCLKKKIGDDKELYERLKADRDGREKIIWPWMIKGNEEWGGYYL